MLVVTAAEGGLRGEDPIFTHLGGCERHACVGMHTCRTWAQTCFQDGAGTEPEPETGTVGAVFPGTENGTGSGGTVFKNRNCAIPFIAVLKMRRTFPKRNRRNRKPEPPKPSHARTVTEPNRGHPVFCNHQEALIVSSIQKLSCILL